MSRLITGQQFESIIKTAVCLSPGWDCFSYDSMACPDWLRRVVHQFDARRGLHSGIRHAPDLVAINASAGGVAFLDAKTGRTNTPNWVIEQESLIALCDWERVANPIPVLIVWPDMTVASPIHVRRHVFDGKPAGPNRTPCWLTSKRAFTERLETYLSTFPPLSGRPPVAAQPNWRTA